MSDKSGWSEEKEDFWGNKYDQHHDEDGNKTGWSEEKETFFGDKYNQDYNENSEKIGWSEEKESFLGDKYDQQYDEEGEKNGWSERKEGFLGNRYTQYHSDSAGDASSQSNYIGSGYSTSNDGQTNTVVGVLLISIVIATGYYFIVLGQTR